MNCPNCKNPNKENSTECEWCGAELIINQDTLNPSKTILRFVFIYNGVTVGILEGISVFINGDLMIKSTQKEGLHFEIENSHTLPIIQIKQSAIPILRLEIPKLDINKNYLITIDYSNWTGIKSKPKSIEEF